MHLIIPRSLTTFSFQVTLALALVSLTPIVQAEEPPFFKDNFADVSSGPKPLDGDGWIASRNLELHPKSERQSGASGAFVTVTNNASFLAKIELPNSAASGTIEIEAELRAVSDSSGTNSWVAIGLGNPTGTNISWREAGLVFLLNTRGEVELLLSGSELSSVKLARVPDYDPAYPATLRLSYNATQQTITASVNDKTIVADYDLANNGFKPEPLFAGFSGYSQLPGTNLVNSFTVRLQR